MKKSGEVFEVLSLLIGNVLIFLILGVNFFQVTGRVVCESLEAS